MQPKYVIQSVLTPLCVICNEAHHLPPPPPFSTPLSLLQKICNPIEFFVSHLISLNTFVYLVSLNIAGGPRGGWGESGWGMWVGTTKRWYSINGKQTIYIKGVLKYKKN